MNSIAYKLWERIKKQVAENPEQLEYLEENSLMKRAANMAKGIKDTIS